MTSATNVRKTYQDHTSWSFQHPSVRYSKVDIDTSSITTLASMPIDTASPVRKVIYYINNYYFLLLNLRYHTIFFLSLKHKWSYFPDM